ncbi:TIGR03617 family F420-dependent LLM class oxidoreductase [Nocardioides stalactiti]|uniref:TIGR03617 family F420-dependent LLM class oxidoreductase n=1 Tax=Nocardioides stalactiti TaxID=2755356 RepID=UPI0016022B15|nr:TIGR03617 family F420-dependent LLM class oxidoreductase [Nocardioides stalactiti]
MNRRLHLDVAFHEAPDRIGTAAAALERHGATGMFVSEAQHDPFVSLAAAAATTDQMILGTSVAIAFARTPMTTAYAAWDVHRLTDGRSVLGLGTQVAGHITRRYGMPWSRPAARMREYVAALHAIWDSWQTGGRLTFEGDFYTHTLMLPTFSPGPLPDARPPIWLAAVGQRMIEVAGEVADGLVIHPLTSDRYRDEILVPAVRAARERAARDDEFTVSAMAMVACGHTEEALAEATALTRMQIGFYASTPAYLPVLEHHGWADLHRDAHALVARGGLMELGSLVDDEVLHTFAVVGEPAAVASRLRQRYGGHVDRVTMTMPFQAVGEGSVATAVLDADAHQVTGANR